MTWVYVLGGWVLLAVIVAFALTLVLRGRRRFNPEPAHAGRRDGVPGYEGTEDALVALIVDDHEPLRRVLWSLLEGDTRFGRTLVASDGEQALAAAREHALDVVLLDVDLPVMDGLEVLPHLVALRPSPAVLLFTAEQSGDVQRAADGQHVRLLSKTTPIDVVIDTMAAAGSGHRALGT
jgi:CheY-like chemotaxis protein